jgi:hypothetical protein
MKNVEDLHFEQQEAQYGNPTAVLRQMYRHSGPDREKTLANARQRLALATSSLARDTESIDPVCLEQERPSSLEHLLRNGHQETLLPRCERIAGEAPLRGARTNKKGPGRLKRLVEHPGGGHPHYADRAPLAPGSPANVAHHPAEPTRIAIRRLRHTQCYDHLPS